MGEVEAAAAGTEAAAAAAATVAGSATTTAMVKKEITLQLRIFDFAGQREYYLVSQRVRERVNEPTPARGLVDSYVHSFIYLFVHCFHSPAQFTYC